jgi:hypothetical protein
MFTGLTLATATLLLMACAGPAPGPQTLAERNELTDSMVGTDPMVTGLIPPAQPGGIR